MSLYDPSFPYGEHRGGGRTTKAIITTIERCRQHRVDGAVIFNSWGEARDDSARFTRLLETGLRDHFFPMQFAVNPITYGLHLFFPGFDVNVKFVALSSWPSMASRKPGVITVDHHAAATGFMPHLREWVHLQTRFDVALRKQGMN